MTAKVKLSFPQMDLLEELERMGSQHVVPTYRPAIKLVELGLAEWQHVERLRITPAGIELLKEVRN
jgi:hypothetical protein